MTINIEKTTMLKEVIENRVFTIKKTKKLDRRG